jgi:flavin reductase (DIM6/NTAB) family NADH-FMN oxidoreductase RutF
MTPNSIIKATLNLPCSVVILSARDGKRESAMTATAMYVSQKPALLVVSVSKTFATYKSIEKTGEFAVNVIADNQLGLAKKFGSKHGFELDKFKENKISTLPATKIHAPLLSGCYANFECKIRSSVWEVEGNHEIYMAEVVSFKIDEDLKPLVWLNNQYFEVGSKCRI